LLRSVADRLRDDDDDDDRTSSRGRERLTTDAGRVIARDFAVDR
jgi:hypothetical protein